MDEPTQNGIDREELARAGAVLDERHVEEVLGFAREHGLCDADGARPA